MSQSVNEFATRKTKNTLKNTRKIMKNTNTTIITSEEFSTIKETIFLQFSIQPLRELHFFSKRKHKKNTKRKHKINELIGK